MARSSGMQHAACATSKHVAFDQNLALVACTRRIHRLTNFFDPDTQPCCP
jgi:hypothetical protein